MNKEIIWQRRFNNMVFRENYNDLFLQPNGSSGYGQLWPLHNLVEAYEIKSSGKLPSEDPNFSPQDPYKDRDPRFYETILYNGAPWQGRFIETFLPGGRDSQEGPVAGWNASLSGYYPRKMLDESIVNPSGNNLGSSPWIYLRYAEILLNYAEAQFYLGNEEVCREYLNMVRSRKSVSMPHVTEGGKELERRLRNERRIELVFEEHRFFDVRRWKIAVYTDNVQADRMVATKKSDGTIDYKIEKLQDRRFEEKHYLAPIPQHEIDKSSLLKQNPGY